jgi:hypothetical protein
LLRVQKMFRGGDGNSWHDVTIDDVIAQTEVQGYFDHGTVTPLLEQGEEIRTPYAVFRNRDMPVKRRLQYFGGREYIRRFS